MNVQSITKTLTCPIESKPLTEAVTLIPCCHKINESAAQFLFDVVENNSCLKDGNCPLCEKNVIAYYPDQSLRELARVFFTEGKEKPVEFSYPGIRARFVHKEGEWEWRDLGELAVLCKFMEFESVVSDSLLKKLTLLGDKNGGLRLCVSFNEENASSLKKYLINLKISPTNFINGCAIFRGNDLNKMFPIIAKNNEIPEEYFQKLKDIIVSGKCELTE